MPHFFDAAMWNNMLGVKLSVLEKILRPVLVYIFLVAMLRIFGKRELAQLNPFDLVVLLSLSNTVQNAIIGNDNSITGGLIGAVTLLATNYLVVRFLFRHRRLDQIFEGNPTTLIENGQVLRHDNAGAGADIQGSLRWLRSHPVSGVSCFHFVRPAASPFF